MHKMKTATVGALLLLLLFSLPSVAGADDLSELKEAIERQERELQILREKVRELEERTEKEEGMETRRKLEKEAAEEMEQIRPKFGINLGAFGDINFSTDNREKVDDGFSLGELALFSTASYRDRLNFLFEAVLEFEEDGETELDIERLWAGYTVSDLLTVRAGRFHTALGYWNKTFHHGKHLFPTTARPFFLFFEGEEGVAPLHIVGLEFSGSADIEVARLKYWLEVGNGPNIIGGKLNPNNAGDNDDSKQVALRISLTPDRFPGFSLGLFGTHFSIDTPAKSDVDESILGFDLYLTSGGLEFISEYFHFTNSDGSADAFYAQLSYSFDVITPYTRYELLDVEEGDPYMSALLGGFDRDQFIAGLRYDLDYLFSSLKAQYRYDDVGDDGRDFNVFEAQWTFHY